MMNEREYDEEPTPAEVAWLFGSENGSGAADIPWQPIVLSDLPNKPPVEPTLGGLGIAYPGKRHVFSGPQESAKTLCAYILGLEVLRRNGLFCLIDFEMGRWEACSRLRELGASQDELARIVYFEPEGRMPDSVPQVVIERTEAQTALVVIDAAAGAFAFEELDDNKRMDVEKFGTRYVEPFRRAGIATLVLDHVVKSSEARGNYAIGSERKVGATDVHLGFTVVTPIKRGGHGVYKVTTHKDRGGFFKRGKLADFELESDPDSHAISWVLKPAIETDEEHPFRPTHLMEKVSRYLELKTEPTPRSHVEQAITGKGEFIRQALDLLTDEGHLEESKGAHNARLVEVIRVYRESDDQFVPSSSQFVPEPADSSSSVRPTPFRGDERDGQGPSSSRSSSQDSLSDDDIPF